jgi:hypothetical protein
MSPHAIRSIYFVYFHVRDMVQFSEEVLKKKAPSNCKSFFIQINSGVGRHTLCRKLKRSTYTSCKSKVGHVGAKGKRRYSSYTLLTSALNGGELSASHLSHVLLLGKGSLVPIGYEAGDSWSEHRG